MDNNIGIAFLFLVFFIIIIWFFSMFGSVRERNIIYREGLDISSEESQEEYLKKFVKYNFDGIEFINNVPKVVFICWFGGYQVENPEMSPKRFEAFKSLVKNIGVPVILITKDNYKNFIKNTHPLHKSFEYLTGNHKSDYLRSYFLHHYGGGYHDIKFRSKDWKECWGEWLKDDNIWMYGRREKYEGAIGYPPGKKYLQKEYNKLATMGWIICKPNTEYTKRLLTKIEEILEEKYEKLLKKPGYNSGGYYSENPFQLAPENSYPLRWLEIMGEIFHPMMLEYKEYIKFGLPDADYKSYK